MHPIELLPDRSHKRTTFKPHLGRIPTKGRNFVKTRNLCIELLQNNTKISEQQLVV